MKVIDLLNKIAKGEEVPKKIKLEEFEYSFEENEYRDFVNGLYLYDRLNNEVEIIEEEKDIEKITNAYYHENQDRINEIFKIKINELIDIVKELKNEKEKT